MEKLNLSPQERRLVAGVGLVVFIVLNFLFVWPRFSDWRNIQSERERAERTLKRYQDEIAKMPGYQAKLRELENSGQNVVADEQDISLAALVQAYRAASGLEVTDNREITSVVTQTNQFFSEKTRQINYRADTEQLINFLTLLTSTNSLIRVRDMAIKPDPPNAPSRLSGSIKLVASYQRKVPVSVSTGGVTNAVTSGKTASAPGTATTARPAAATTTNKQPATKPSNSTTNASPKPPGTATPNSTTPKPTKS